MARKKSTDNKVKDLVSGFVAELLPLLRQRVQEELAAARTEDEDGNVEFHFEDGGTLGAGSVPPIADDVDALDQGPLIEFEIETIPETQRDPGLDESDNSIPQTIYPT